MLLRVLCCQCEDMEFKGLKRQTSLKSMSPFCTDLRGSEVFDRQGAAARRLQRQESLSANKLVSAKLTRLEVEDMCGTQARHKPPSFLPLFTAFFRSLHVSNSVGTVPLSNNALEHNVDGLHCSILYRGMNGD